MNFESTVTVTCSDNGKSSVSEVINFIEKNILIVSLNRSIRLELIFNPRNGLYVGNQAGLEFVSKGPKEQLKNVFKRRK
jgi:hypothetical protein